MSEANARSKELNFKGIISVIFILAVFVFFATVFFDGLNKHRAEKLHKEYTDESLQYMEKNRAGLTQIFAEMQSTNCAFSPCGSVDQDEIMHTISSDLKDFSSTAFIAINKSGEVMLMRLSGEKDLLYSSDPPTMKIKELLNGSKTELPWDDYIYFYEGKEVLVPFKNNDGKIMGLLLRAVVAK
jgi:hypothetical protein